MIASRTSKVLKRELERHENTEKTMFGFWVYLMTDCVLFASLFAVYAVMRTATFGGPNGAEIFNPQYVLLETLLLLTSSFTVGLGVLAARKHDKTFLFIWFAVTFLLGTAFLGMELSEFRHLVVEGDSWRRSGFLSAFFTLVGTHGLHIFSGLLWMVILLGRVAQKGLTPITIRRLTLLSIFWHFLDLIWIFIFTIVYMMGVVNL